MHHVGLFGVCKIGVDYVGLMLCGKLEFDSKAILERKITNLTNQVKILDNVNY